MTIKNKHLFLIVFILPALFINAAAQEFKIRATLQLVPVTGFYKIPVTPALSGYAKDDLSDVRIVTDSNVPVPYINQNEIKSTEPGSFRECPVISNTTVERHTTVVLENPLAAGITNTGISNIYLEIKNNEVERYTALSGSDDKNKWYIINDSIRLTCKPGNDAGNYRQEINFPLSKYKYFRLKINNNNSDPLSIVGAGIFVIGHTTAPRAIQIANPDPSFTQKDSNNRSYIIINNKSAWLTDSIAIDVSGPKFYDRATALYIMHDEKDSSSLSNPVAGFTISSGKPGFVKFGRRKALIILLEIDNKDNHPLKITHVTTYQEQQYLIAWLDKGKDYSLLAANPNANAPQYDLAHFRNDIPGSVPVLSYGPLFAVPQAATVIKQNSNFWLWPTIIIAVVVLSFLTFRLMKDMKQSGS